MEEAGSKRRKLGHPNGGPSLANGPATTFTLETEELLKEVKVNYEKTFAGADDLLRQLKEALEAIEEHDSTPIAEATKALEKASGIKVPYPDPKPTKESPYKVSIARPAQVNVVGSYVLKTMVKTQHDPAIDMVVVMPASLFQEKDYLNLRYFYKRAFYLAKLSAAIREALGSSLDITFEYLHGNALLPIVVARPKASKEVKGDSKKKKQPKGQYAIKIIPCAPDGSFPKTKLGATSNAIRQGQSGEGSDTQPPTPFYNTSLKAESSYLSYLKLLHHASKSCPGFKDACILGRIWLQQRNLGDNAFGHFEWAVLVALLLQGGGRKGAPVLSSSLSSTQLFKAVIQFLATMSFSTKPLVIGDSKQSFDNIRQSGPVLYDAARDLNVLFKMTTSSAALLQQYAKWSLQLLTDTSADQFNSMFITKADQPLQTFDLLVKVKLPAATEKPTSADRRGHLLDFGDKLYQTLKKALGDRAQLVHVQTPEVASWPTSAAGPKTKSSELLVGIIFDPLNMSRKVDHGPPVEDKKQAAAFRAFWGEKAELRRFADGSILESLIWTKVVPAEICEEIVRYVLKLRLQRDSDSLEIYPRDFSSHAPISSGDSQIFKAAKEAFSTLEHDLRNLEDMPLRFRQIAATAPELRYSSTRPPSAAASKTPSLPMDVVIFFEASSSWPDSLAAIQRAKIAFLQRIGTSLEELETGIVAHIGLEDAELDIENLAFLDITYQIGASFRLRIHSDLEESLLERRTKDRTLDEYIRKESADLLATFRRLYTHLPLHNQTVSTFCTRFPALSSSIRLVKHWFNSHKLTCHFNEELIELFALQAFLQPYPWQTPSSPTTGFLRTLLLVSKWDWRSEPLIVDSSDSLSAADRSAINTRLDAWRKIDPNMNHTVLFVATSHDTTGTAYTTVGPSRVVATRMTSLARSASKLARERGIELDPRSLFQTSLKDYEVLIQLSSKGFKSVVRDDSLKTSLFKNLNVQLGEPRPPIVQYPARVLLKKLRDTYDSPLLFFHGGEDDRTIGAIWNPQLKRRTFRVNLPCAFKPVGKGEGEDADEDEEELMEVDKRVILAEIARVGGDLIEKIEG